MVRALCETIKITKVYYTIEPQGPSSHENDLMHLPLINKSCRSHYEDLVGLDSIPFSVMYCLRMFLLGSSRILE